MATRQIGREIIGAIDNMDKAAVTLDRAAKMCDIGGVLQQAKAFGTYEGILMKALDDADRSILDFPEQRIKYARSITSFARSSRIASQTCGCNPDKGAKEKIRRINETIVPMFTRETREGSVPEFPETKDGRSIRYGEDLYDADEALRRMVFGY